MNTFQMIKINERFFEALDKVVGLELIRGLQTFTNEHNIDKRNLVKTKKNSTTMRVHADWIYFLCTDFNISPEWIITGRGSMFKE